MDETIKNTYNAVFGIIKNGILDGCDPELAGILIRHKDEKERDFFMHLTYNLAKKYSQGEMDWDAFMEHTSSVYEKTGENPMYFELMNYFARRFERIERTEGK